MRSPPGSRQKPIVVADLTAMFVNKSKRTRECRMKIGWLVPKSILLAILMAGAAPALTGEQYPSEAKVPPAQARQIALKSYTGKILPGA